MQRFVLFAICWSLALPALADDPVPPHLAIISDAGTKDLAALLTTELSSNPALTLIDRDALAKISDEAKMQAMAGSDAPALGKLLGADGLLFLDQRPDGLHARLTAVNLGYELADDAVPPGLDPPQQVKALAHLVAIDAAKLKLEAAHAVPISVLNFRADAATADTLKFERNLTLLVEGNSRRRRSMSCWNGVTPGRSDSNGRWIVSPLRCYKARLWWTEL